MAKDKDKILANAQKLVQKGQVDKAIKEFKNALALDKKDVKTHLRLGDLFNRKKDKESAIHHYCEAAKYYTKDGFYSKAVAVYKQALQLESTRTDIVFNLADLYHKLGLINDAMSQYQTVATHYERDGMVKEAIETIRRMAELDPKNVVVLTKLAELHYKNGQKEDGYNVFRRALDELKEAGRFEEYSRLLEKLAKADPDNTENLKELCSIYLKRGVFDRAYQVLARIYKNDPEDLESLQNLAQVCAKINRPDEAVEFLKALASKYKGRGLNDKAKEALRRVLQIKPNDPDAKRVLGAEAARPPKPVEEDEPAELLEEVVEAEEVYEPEPIEALEELPEDEVTIDEPEPAEEQVKLNVEQIQEHLTEAEVYLKYGLKDKAMHHVNTVLKSDPINIKAHQKLKDIQLDAGQTGNAIKTLYKVSELAQKQNDGASARQALQEILSLDSSQAQAQTMLKSLAEPAAAARPAARKPLVPEEPEIIEEAEEEPVVLEEEEQEEIIEEEAPPVAVKKKPSKKPAPAAAKAAGPRDFREELEEAEFYIQQGLEDEATKIYLEILKQDPTHEESLRKLDELGAAEVEEKEAVEPEVTTFELAPEEEEIVEEAAEEAPIDIRAEEEEPIVEEEEEIVEEELAEVSEEAPEPVAEEAPAAEEEEEVVVEEEEEVPAAATPEPRPAAPPQVTEPTPPPPPPEEPAMQVELKIEPPPEPEPQTLTIETPAPPEPEAPPVAAEAPPVEAAVSPPPAPAPTLSDFIPPEIGEDQDLFGGAGGDEGLFDLAAELEQEDFGAGAGVKGEFSTAEKFSFEDTFSAFKKGVAEQVSSEDSATHYDLGIAYKEMGLLDDAISEFQVSLEGAGGNKADCYLMIGLCYQEKGQQEQAIETYRKGLERQGVTDKEAVVFYYEIGSSYLSMSERALAKQNFEKAQSMDPGFRDVQQKLEELKEATAAEPPPPEPESTTAPSREQVSWESAALNNDEPEPQEKGEEKKAGKKKKISYV